MPQGNGEPRPPRPTQRLTPDKTWIWNTDTEIWEILDVEPVGEEVSEDA